MKKRRDFLGIVLLALGVILLLNAFHIFSFNIFFDGWWTLFLIIPAAVSMSRTGLTAGNAVLMVIGIGFLLTEQGWDFRGYIVPALFIVIGLVILFKKI